MRPNNEVACRQPHLRVLQQRFLQDMSVRQHCGAFEPSFRVQLINYAWRSPRIQAVCSRTICTLQMNNFALPPWAVTVPGI